MLTVIAGLMLFMGSVPAAGASAQQSTISEKCVGENNQGDFQAALDDGLRQTDEFYNRLGIDIRYSYLVLWTRGVRGGIAGSNLIRVEIWTKTCADRRDLLSIDLHNPFAGRLIGSIRRACLDHVLVSGERHLRCS